MDKPHGMVDFLNWGDGGEDFPVRMGQNRIPVNGRQGWSGFNLVPSLLSGWVMQ
ncbi:MAG: hypothetical protein ACYCOO_02995 [Chitinophagaceae bacterium]